MTLPIGMEGYLVPGQQALEATRPEAAIVVVITVGLDNAHLWERGFRAPPQQRSLVLNLDLLSP